MLNKIIFISVILSVGWIYPIQADINTVPSISYEIECSKNNLTHIDLPSDCPEIYQTLLQQGLTHTLETPLLNQMSQRQLRILIRATLPSENQAVLLNGSDLDSLLADIYVDKKKNLADSWWKQILDWLNRNKPEQYEAEYTWLVDFIEAITPSADTFRLIMYSIFYLIIAVIFVFLLRGISLTELFNRKKSKQKKDNLTNEVPTVNLEQRLSIAEIEQLAPTEQSIALLKNVIAYLTHNQSLPNNKALTNSELKQFLQQQDLSSAFHFSELLADIEPVLYGNVIPSEQLLENCWHNTKQIIQS